MSIFLAAPFENTLARAAARDQSPSQPATEVQRRYRSRYIPSQEFYFDTARPQERANIIVHNADPQRPAWEIRTP